MANETILIIDDSHDNRLFLSKYILEPAGYQVLTARDGVDGLNKTIKHQPDLLLLDLQMPRMNGIEVMKALRKREMQVPIILMTFHGSEEIIINVSRGALIDTVALIDALKSGHVAGVGLDVYEEEEGKFFEDLSGEVMTDDVLARLLTFPNVIVTAHQAFLTREALDEIARVTTENITALSQGQSPDESRIVTV